MRQDLDALCAQFEREATARGLLVFHGFSRRLEEGVCIFWDVERRPNLNEFLDVAQGLGVKLLVFNHRRLRKEMVEDAFQRLEECDMPAEERHDLERRLKKSRMYEGFTCTLEFSFDFQGRTHFFDVRTDWYEDLVDALDMIHFYSSADEDEDEEEEEEGEEGPAGGYFSRN